MGLLGEPTNLEVIGSVEIFTSFNANVSGNSTLILSNTGLQSMKVSGQANLVPISGKHIQTDSTIFGGLIFGFILFITCGIIVIGLIILILSVLYR